MESICPVCQQKLNKHQERPETRDGDFFSCPRCGDFFASGSALSILPRKLESIKDSSAKISHMLRHSYEYGNKNPTLYSTTIDEVLKKNLPNPREQADLLIRWFGKTIDGPGERIEINSMFHRSIIGAKSDEGFALIVNHLFEKEMLDGHVFETMRSPFGGNFTLSFDAWDYYEELNRGNKNYRKAFIAMKFGDHILDQIVESVFKPSVKQAGFDLIKLDDEPIAGLIDDRLRVEIQSSQFLIADLSHDNPGAYWEAGYAEGLGKPVIYACEKSKFEKEKTHFDTNHHLTVIWDSNNPDVSGISLKATIRATFPDIAKMED